MRSASVQRGAARLLLAPPAHAAHPAQAGAAAASGGVALRVRLAAQRAALHTSSAVRQKTAAKVGAAKAKS